MKNPWLKFYPADWRADPALRACSVGARGLWIEILCLMHEATPCGSLTLNGKQMTNRQLAALSGLAAREVGDLLSELEEAGVFSRDKDGTIFSRRMRRDVEKAARDRANGKGGGNPNLRPGVNPPDNPDPNPRVNGGHKAQKLEARGLEAASLPHATLSAIVLVDDLEAKLRAAAGAEQNPSPGLFDTSPIYGLIAEGFDLVTEILPVIRAKPNPRLRTWSYHVPAIRDAREKRIASGRPAPRAAAPVDPDEPRVDFGGGVTAPEKLVLDVIRRGEWLDGWGPRLGRPGCRLPQRIVDTLSQAVA